MKVGKMRIVICTIATIISVSICLATCGLVVAQEQNPTAEQVHYFERHIRPALVKYCYQCHSIEAGDSRAGLLVDTRDGLLQGGDSGPAITPGSLDESPFWEAINWDGYEMPPSQKMPDDVIAHFETWIEMGAPDPRERKLQTVSSKITQEDIEKGAQHWAYQVPKAKADASIDGLVLENLRQQELTPAPPADPLTLLRRLSFDLLGLPPSVEEMVAFKKAWDQDAEAAIIQKTDQLLKQPQYGERWGRHWLDVARYAESSGFYNTTFPHAWRYRDYVIESFNEDTPYDRFLEEQIVGDLLPVKNDAQWQKNLIATGFLAVGAKRLNERNPRQFAADMVDEQIDTLTQAVLGTTVSCARCHDHKFDPIPAADYYALAGIFQSTETYYGTKDGGQNHRPGDLLLLPILDRNPKGNQSVADLEAQIDELRKRRASMRESIGPDGEKDVKAFARLRRREASLKGELSNLNRDGTRKTFGMGVQEADRFVNANILVAGDIDQPAQQVPRGFLQVLGDVNFQVDDSKSSGRKQLVEALISKDNPLTARVMVNRIWMHLIGRPLVATPNNFGMVGMTPDNQELLDYLAVRFMQHDWSVKALIREIVLTDTYQRSSKYDQQNYAIDPENRMLWRANPRQLDAESLRDATLMIAGRLDLQPPMGSEVTDLGDIKFGRNNSVDDFDQDNRHRSVYLPIIRDELQESLQLFDFPDPNIPNANRSQSIIPTQALYLMNGEFVTSQSVAMAGSLTRRFKTTNEQVRQGFLLAYGRPATDDEMQASVQFLKSFTPSQPIAQGSQNTTPRRRNRNAAGSNDAMKSGGRRRTRKTESSPADTSTVSVNSHQQTLAAFCQALMASAEFRMLD